MARPSVSSRWRGERRSSAANTRPESQERVYVDFGARDQSEAAVERWLTTTTIQAESPSQLSEQSIALRQDSTISNNHWTVGRHSDPGVSRLSDLQVVRALDDSAPRSQSLAGEATTTRGKRLLRERLKLKSRQRHQSPSKKHRQPTPERPNQMDTQRLSNKFSSDRRAMSRERGVMTPSTVASTQTPLSPQSLSMHSLQTDMEFLSMTGGTPSGSEGVHTTGPNSSRVSSNTEIHNGERQGRRNIEAAMFHTNGRMSSPQRRSVSTPRGRSKRSTIPPTLPMGNNATSPSASTPGRGPFISKLGTEDMSLTAVDGTGRRNSPPQGITSPPSQFANQKRSMMERNLIYSVESVTASQPKNGLLKQFSTYRTSTSRSAVQQQQQQQPQLQHQLPPQHDSDEEREKWDKRMVRDVAAETSMDKRQSYNSVPPPPPPQQQQPLRSNRIRLHVYDLIAQETIMQLPWGCHFPIGQCFNAVNSGLHTLGTGAYHVGIEINGIEYAYGANNTRGMTGVFTCMPMNSPGYQYRTTIDLGDRTLIRKSRNRRDSGQSVDGREIVREMAAEYMGLDYDLLRKNCVTFSHDACLRLGVKDNEIPDWFRNLCVVGAAAQDAANSTIEPISKVFSSCDMEGFTDMVNDSGFEVITDQGNSRAEEIVDTESAY